jgi:FMN reductase
MRVTVVAGNPKPASRTLQVGVALAESLCGTTADLQVIDLAEHVDELFAWPSETMQTLNRRVAESDLVVLATPTYKASYTGLLKAFLDRYPANGLENVAAIPLFTGADLQHSMAPNVTLVPLLLELGAIVPGRGVYFVMSQHDRMPTIVEAEAQRIRESLVRLAAVSAVTEAVTA